MRQTIVVLATQNTVRWLIGRATPQPGSDPSALKMRMELQRAREQHADDPIALQDAIMCIHRDQPTTPAIACLPALIRAITAPAINRLPVPFLSERRTVADLLAGTKLVDKKPSRWMRLRRITRRARQ